MTYYSSSPSARPKTLMEMLLAKKIEAAAAAQGATGLGGPGTSLTSKLLRTDSFDSVSSLGSSLGSLVLGDDVCRCDDCLLGIVDLWIAGPAEKAMAKKKVYIIFIMFLLLQLPAHVPSTYTHWLVEWYCLHAIGAKLLTEWSADDNYFMSERWKWNIVVVVHYVACISMPIWLC